MIGEGQSYNHSDSFQEPGVGDGSGLRGLQSWRTFSFLSIWQVLCTLLGKEREVDIQQLFLNLGFNSFLLVYGSKNDGAAAGNQ